MHQTPPTAPRRGTAATEPLPARGPRTSFYATIGCLSLIAGLVLGVGGFFGVRAVQDGGDAPITGEETTEPTVLDKTPVGADSAVPLGSTFPVSSTALGGEVEVTLTAVDWDATEEIRAANSFNEQPEEGEKYLLLTVEGVYHGDGYEDWQASNWIDVVYVAEDGTEHDRIFRVTPHHDELIGQKGVAEDGSFLSEFCFTVPADLEAGGHFVLADYVSDINAGAWVQAV